MALLDQLFRLRGAPRAATRPVTLGALVAALPEAVESAKPTAIEPGSAASSTIAENHALPAHGGSRNEPGDAPPAHGGSRNESGDALPARGECRNESGDALPAHGGSRNEPGDAFPARGGSHNESGDALPARGGSGNEPGDALPGGCSSGNEQGKTGSDARKRQITSDLEGTAAPGGRPAPATQAAVAIPAARREESPSGQRRNATRFNPFSTSSESPPQERANPQIAGKRAASGPCLEDPALPPLRLQAQVATDAGERPVVLGAAAVVQPGEATAALQQIEAPAVRLAPLKSPARVFESAPPAAARPLLLRLEIQAESSLDVVAFKQYAAKFPGVVKCVISNARS